MPLSKSTPGVQSIALTPLVDVVFILLLFFMLTSVFETSRQIPLSTKSRVTSNTKVPHVRAQVLALGADVVWVDGKTLQLQSSDFQALMRQWQSENKAVAVGGKQGTKIQHLISLIDHLHRAGMRNVKVFESVDQF